MNWLTNFVKPKLKVIKSKILKKENLWFKCNSCEQMIFYKDLEEKMYVCSNCENHLQMPVRKRLKHLYDEQNFEEIQLKPVIEDPLIFKEEPNLQVDKLNFFLKIFFISEDLEPYPVYTMLLSTNA